MNNNNQKIEPLNQAYRVLTFFLNVIVFWIIYKITTDSWFPSGSGESIWLLSAIAFWLLSLVAAPFFSPPKDSLGTAISIILLLVPLDLSGVIRYSDIINSLNVLTVVFSAIVIIAALIAIFNKSNQRLKQSAYNFSHTFGKGEVLYTASIIISVFAFYQENVDSVFLILGMWVFFVTAKPIELLLKTYLYLRNTKDSTKQIISTGSILRVDDPNLLRVILKNKSCNWNSNFIHVARMSNGKVVHVLPLFTQQQEQENIGTGLCCDIDNLEMSNLAVGEVSEILVQDGLIDKVRSAIGLDNRTSKIAGIVVEGSSISNLKFQALRGIDLEEGMVVFTLIKNKRVYYQILDAKTDEESLQQNPYGAHIVSAVQLGLFDKKDGFKKFSWLPEMNQPVFFDEVNGGDIQELSKNEFLVGNISSTSFGIPVVLDDLIQYHSAVLGVTGTGKTELALDIIKNALDHNVKVFCVDFTGEYKSRLSLYDPQLIGLSVEQGSDLEKKLFEVETGTYGAATEKANLKIFLDEIKPQVFDKMSEFLTDTVHKLGIFELDQITNTKATLRTTEMFLSAIMDWARKNRKREKILIVLEEAHTIIPEAYQSGFDADTQWVVSRIGQIALQGRKYGVGLLLVSQRTALVSKTILSQCNTYFTHALMDKTSLEYLGSIYSAEYIKAVPNLKFLEFIAHGKAIKSDRPLLGRRLFDPKKVEESKKLDYKEGDVKLSN